MNKTDDHRRHGAAAGAVQAKRGLTLPTLTKDEEIMLTKGDPRFQPYILKEGMYWRLYLNAPKQHLLGRAYLWLTTRHVDLMEFDQLTELELRELQQLVRRYRDAMAHLFGATRLNVQWWGNEHHSHRGHGHMHLVPRYASPAEFEGRTYADPRFGKNYHPYTDPIFPAERLEQLCAVIKAALN